MSTRPRDVRRLVLSGPAVGALAVAAGFALLGLDLLLTGRLSLFFDLGFVTVCVVAALAVPQHGFFPVGVMPPLLMFAVVLLLASTARGTVADPVDGLVQAVVTGLTHHAGALLAGHAGALLILAVRHSGAVPAAQGRAQGPAQLGRQRARRHPSRAL